MTEFNNTHEYAKQLDSLDELSKYRSEFNFPYVKNHSDNTNINSIYLSGHSLGLQPKRSVDAVNEALQAWHKFGVEGHTTGDWPWLPYHEFITDYLALIVGAKQSEVVCMNSLTTNLHLLMLSFYRPNASKYKILIEETAFPSDDYAVQSQVAFHGYNPDDAIIRLKPREGEYHLRTEDVNYFIEQNHEQIALILLPGVQYYTGQVYDIKSITNIAHKKNVLIGFDCAHAAGNIELNLHDWNVDFAVWCHYKYLNSGPGAVGGCFVHERHISDASLKKLTGWWGHDKKSRFDMPQKFKAIPTVESWQLSNPPILSLASIRGALSLFKDVGSMSILQKKSQTLSSYLINLLTLELSDFINIITPEDQKGSQVSIKFKKHQAKDVSSKLLEHNIITDYRNPDVMRVAPVPLYNSFGDVWKFISILKGILHAK